MYASLTGILGKMIMKTLIILKKSVNHGHLTHVSNLAMKKKKNNNIHEEYYICTNKDALNMNIICHDCSTACPHCKRVSKKEYDKFWENYDNE